VQIFFGKAETTGKSCIERVAVPMVGVLVVKKGNQKFSVETSQNETAVLKRFFKSGEKQLFKFCKSWLFFRNYFFFWKAKTASRTPR
jgi:hypothetical protein